MMVILGAAIIPVPVGIFHLRCDNCFSYLGVSVTVWGWWRQYRRRRILRTQSIAEEPWQAAFRLVPMIQRLSSADERRLRDLALLFIREKNFEGASGLQVTEEMKLVIALQAGLLILELSLDWYNHFRTVIIYPTAFVPRHHYVDEAGVVHEQRWAQSGEAWHRGPVILSWEDTLRGAAHARDGHNVVIHEFAHQLDMRNSSVDGAPHLHRGMNPQAWQEDFTEAYEMLCAAVKEGRPTAVDPYAAGGPGEYFAVMSEVFFEKPHLLRSKYPKIYGHLRDFYRQNPAGEYPPRYRGS